MPATLGSAYVQIIPTTNGIESALTSTLTGATAKPAEEAGQEGGKKLTAGLSKTVAASAAVIATALSGACAAAVSMTGATAELGDSIDKSSQKLGVSSTFYQEWEAVLQHSGTSMDAMGATFKKLATESQSASDAQQAAFERLGLSMESVRSMSTEELFASVVTGLQSMEEGTERTAVATTLLGRGASELGALFNTSAEDTQGMIDRVHELGGVMSVDAVKACAQYQDDLQDMQTTFAGIRNELGVQLMPVLSTMMGTVSQNMPAIKSAIDGVFSVAQEVLVSATTEGTAFNTALDAMATAAGLAAEGVGFVGDNLNIILPILGAVALAVGIVTAGIGLHNAAVAIKTAMTAAETTSVLGLVAAMAAQAAAQAAVLLPYVAVAAAISAVIAVIVLCVKHWDDIKRVMSNVADTAKTTVLNGFNSIKTGVGNAVNTVKTTVSNAFNSIKTGVGSAVNTVKTTVSSAFNAVKSTISNTLGGAKNTVDNILNGIKSKFSGSFDAVKTTVSNAIGKVKGIMNFSWSLPKLKLPHFSVSGGKAPWGFGGVGSLPSVSVQWYAKAMNNAMVLDSPTIFGANAQGLLGGGEAGREIVAGASLLEGMIERAVERGNAQNREREQPIVITVNSVLDGNIIGHNVVQYIRHQTFMTGINPLAGTI